MYMHTYIHTYMHTYTHTSAHTYIHTRYSHINVNKCVLAVAWDWLAYFQSSGDRDWIENNRSESMEPRVYTRSTVTATPITVRFAFLFFFFLFDSTFFFLSSRNSFLRLFSFFYYPLSSFFYFFSCDREIDEEKRWYKNQPLRRTYVGGEWEASTLQRNRNRDENMGDRLVFGLARVT